MKDIQKIIQTLLEELVDQGAERGVQVAVYLKGEKIVDAAAGIADPATGRTVDRNTLFPIFSTTKGIAATLAHIAVEQGKVAYETRIADVWPEFAAHGKGGLTLRHALNHTAGLQNMPMGLDHAQLCDWDFMSAAIADLTPVSAPGMEMAYHAITYSWTVGEVLRRVTGRPFSQIMREEICDPLGITAEMFVGIPNEVESRVAILEAESAESAQQTLPTDTVPQSIPPLVQPLHAWMNRPDARRACIPASNGIMTAHSIAKHYAALLPGGVDGVELLSPERIRLATEMQIPGSQLPDAPPSGRGLGYSVGGTFSPKTFGHNGYGGSVGVADPLQGLAFGFARNRCSNDASLKLIVAALRDGAGITSA